MTVWAVAESVPLKRWRVCPNSDFSDIIGKLPSWAADLGFGLFLDQGWNAHLDGRKVASGKWGDELYLLTDGKIGCTEYPNGWSIDAAVAKGYPTPSQTVSQDRAVEAVARIGKYIAEYEDAPSWGGPTMYPAPPSVADLRLVLAAFKKSEVGHE